MEPRTTHHSQSDSPAWPEQALGEHGQGKLQVSMARASSRRAEQAPGEQTKLQENTEQVPGEHRAGSRRAQRRIEEGKHLLDA
jgi:hypothetical protein